MCVVCVCFDADDPQLFLLCAALPDAFSLARWFLLCSDSVLPRDAALDGAQPDIVFTVSTGSFQ